MNWLPPHGLPIPKRVAKTFKVMQDALGDWHDEVVLAERILRAVVDAELPLHRPAEASAVLDVARAFLQRSERSLARFSAQWKRGGQQVRQTLDDRVPLTTPATPPAAVVIEEPTIAVESPTDSGDETATVE